MLAHHGGCCWVARTIADLAGHERVSREDVLTALTLPQRSGPERGIIR